LLFAKEDSTFASLESAIQSTKIWSAADAKVVEKYFYDKNGHNYLARAQGMNLQYLGYHGQWLQIMDLTFISDEVNTKYLQYLYSRGHDLESRVASLEAKIKAGDVGALSKSSELEKETSVVIEKNRFEGEYNDVIMYINLLESKINDNFSKYTELERIVIDSDYMSLKYKIIYLGYYTIPLLFDENEWNARNIIEIEERTELFRIYDSFNLKDFSIITKQATIKEPEKVTTIPGYWRFLPQTHPTLILKAHNKLRGRK